MKNISIIGTGMIGCSIAQGAKGMFRNVIGFDTNRLNLEYAIKTGIIDHSWSIDRIALESDVIIVATPVDSAILVIPDLLSRVKDDAVVIDVGSTKSLICSELENHPNRRNFVAAHPMAGSEIGGPHGSDGKLFNDRNVIICQPDKSSSAALDTAVNLFREAGMMVDFMNVDEHDSLVALVSHLPQVVSYGIMNTVGHATQGDQQWCSLASDGFDSATRLAKSSSKVWTPILLQNRENINLYIGLLVKQLEFLQSMMVSGDHEGITRYIEQSQALRRNYEESRSSIKSNGVRSELKILL